MILIPSLLVFLVIYVVSFMIVLSCQDWFLIWFGLEINMMSFILLMFRRNSMLVIESCMKYFFIQGLGSAVFMSLFYFGSEIMEVLSSFILTFKLGGGPFFFWFPAVCEGISWLMCFMLMSLQKVMPLVLMLLVVNSALWVMIIMSLIVGVMGSFSQSSMKRLLAYSSVHHIGWLIMCQVEKAGMWLYYLVMYTFVLMSVVWVLAEEEVISISDLMSMKKKWFLVFGMLNMGGMPPLLGFFLKWWALMSFMDCDYTILVFMIMLSVVMFYVYLRVVYDSVLGMKVEESWNVKEFYVSCKFDGMGLVGVFIGLMGGMMLSML